MELNNRVQTTQVKYVLNAEEIKMRSSKNTKSIMNMIQLKSDIQEQSKLETQLLLSTKK